MTRQTVRPKRSKKQQREAEAKRREQGRSKQRSYIARKKAEGKLLIRFWVTPDEKKVLEKIRLMLPELVQLELEKTVSTNPTENTSSEKAEGQY